MKFKVTYTATCAEAGGSGHQIFDADDNNSAKEKAKVIVAEIQRETNEPIKSRFWHYRFEITGLFQVRQEEIAEPVSL
jgi:hypothetical protein